jgi:signal transduction histidine kinase
MGGDYLAPLNAETGLQLEWPKGSVSGIQAKGIVPRGASTLHDDQRKSIGSPQTGASREITENAGKTIIVLGLGYVAVVRILGDLIIYLLKIFVLGRVSSARAQMERIAREIIWNEAMDLGGNDEIARRANQFNLRTGELEQVKGELIQTNGSLERYARSLSHDLRSPLSTLNLNMALLRCAMMVKKSPK